MIELLDNIHVVTPEIILLITGSVALICELFFSRHVKDISFYCAIFGLIITSIASYSLLGNYRIQALGNLFVSDDIAQLMKVFIGITVILSLFYGRYYLRSRQIPVGDYQVLALFSTLGMMILVSANSLLTIYLGLELVSLPLYAMTAIRRNNSNSSEAGMKYFVMGAIASGMLLYGFSLLYGATGKLELNEIANHVAVHWQQENTLLSFALVFIIAGIGFKLAAIPFHMWAPDVYEGAPTSVTLFISAAPKIAAIGMTLRLLSYALPDMVFQWQQLILVMALLSTGLGNLLAISQNNIKRLFAYSAIAHMGYALFGILSASVDGYAASLYYVLVYALMSAGAFGLITIMSHGTTEIENIGDLKGLNKRNPWLAFMMMIILFSMAGVPPTVGFFIKLFVLKALVDAQMTWVAILGLFFAVIGAFYYLRVIKVMYFDDAEKQEPIIIPQTAWLLFSVNSLSLLYLGIFPGALVAACMNALS